MKTEKEKLLNTLCLKFRKDIIKMLYEVRSGHPGGSLSVIEIMTVLYFDVLNIDSKNPNDHNRDIFILSKGHAA